MAFDTDDASLSSGMSPSEVECCFKQILNGVAYLHSQGVAHRDIKPENLFFDTRGHLKVFLRPVPGYFAVLTLHPTVRLVTTEHRPSTASLGKQPCTCRQGFAVVNLTLPRSSF